MVSVEQFLLVAVTGCLVYMMALRSLALVLALSVGLVARVVVGWLDFSGVISLPWSGKDSEAFYAAAVAYHNLDWASHLSEFDPQRSYVFSWVLGWFLRVFGEGEFYLRVINMQLGCLSAIITYRALLVAKVRKKVAFWGASFFLLFPFSIILSSVLLREAVIALGVAVIGFGLVKYYAEGRLFGLLLAVLGSLASALIHGGLGALLIVILLLVAAVPPRLTLPSGMAGKSLVSLEQRVLIFVFAVFFLAVVLVFADFSKLGNPTEAWGALNERLDRVADRGSKGESGYPLWLTQNIHNPLYWLPRFVYFMGAPFPWDWRNVFDAIAGLVGFSYIVLCFWSFRARQFGGVFLVLGLVLLAGLLLFSVGTDNIGTSIRHRSKFLPLLIIAGFTWIGKKAVYPRRTKVERVDVSRKEINYGA